MSNRSPPAAQPPVHWDRLIDETFKTCPNNDKLSSREGGVECSAIWALHLFTLPPLRFIYHLRLVNVYLGLDEMRNEKPICDLAPHKSTMVAQRCQNDATSHSKSHPTFTWKYAEFLCARATVFGN